MMTIATPHYSSDGPARVAREALLHFSPNWFAVTMGTGVVAAVLGQFPTIRPLWEAGFVLWVINIALFSVFSVCYALKWLMFPARALRVFDHSTMSMFLGCIPMGLATNVNGCLIFGVPVLGPAMVPVAEAFWVLSAVLAVGVGLLVPFMMFTRQDHAIQQMSAVWLLPVVASEVAAASGALLLPHLADGEWKLMVMLADYVLWACSVPLALGILVILFLRLVLHKLPPAAMAATSWLALGPIGTGALGLALLSVAAVPVLEAHGLGAVATAIGGASLLGALLLWAYGLWWLAMACAISLRYLRDGVPFNLGWWSYTFPLGVYSLATLKLATLIPLPLLGWFGGLLVVGLVGAWGIVASRTLLGAVAGHLFDDPSVVGPGPSAVSARP